MTPLPADFLRLPIAHRALHDKAAGRIENGPSAIRAAVEAGYGIEIDVQPTLDGHAMVFHDAGLERLTGRSGEMRALTMSQARTLPLVGGRGDTVPTLAECLSIVAGRVPLLIEIKDQDGAMGADVGALEHAVARDLAAYSGPVAVMSFNPHSVAMMQRLAPGIARGLVTFAWAGADADGLSDARRADLARMAMFDDTGAAFISHDARDLASPNVARLKARGVPVLTWTIRSLEAERQAREVADNITFEGYRPAVFA